MKTRGIRVKPQISQIEEGLADLFFGSTGDRNSHRTVVKKSSGFQSRSLYRKMARLKKERKNVAVHMQRHPPKRQTLS